MRTQSAMSRSFFSNCLSEPLAEVMSPGTIKTTNEPAPSKNVYVSPGHAVHIRPFKWFGRKLKKS